MVTTSKANLTQSEFSKDKTDPRYKEKVALDGGNRTICWSDGCDTHVIPAYVCQLPEYQDSPSNLDSQSVFIEASVAGQNARYLVGQAAKYLGGQPIFQLSKAEVTWLLALVASQPNPEQDAVLIDELRILYIDSRNEDVAKLKEIASTGIDFKRNGKDCIATIRSVQVEDEGLPVHCYAMRHNLFRYPNRPNAVIDLGGGDGTARVITPMGMIDRKADINLPGTTALASDVSARLQQRIRFSPNQGEIMDAIERGDYTIQIADGQGFEDISFSAEFNAAQEHWIERIRGEINSKWGAIGIFETLGGGIIVGGSAPLAKGFEESTNGRFIVAENDSDPRFAQLISLYGMLE